MREGNFTWWLPCGLPTYVPPAPPSASAALLELTKSKVRKPMLQPAIRQTRRCLKRALPQPHRNIPLQGLPCSRRRRAHPVGTAGLNAQGCTCRTPDGVAGRITRAYITDLPRDSGLPEVGQFDIALVQFITCI